MMFQHQKETPGSRASSSVRPLDAQVRSYRRNLLHNPSNPSNTSNSSYPSPSPSYPSSSSSSSSSLSPSDYATLPPEIRPIVSRLEAIHNAITLRSILTQSASPSLSSLSLNIERKTHKTVQRLLVFQGVSLHTFRQLTELCRDVSAPMYFNYTIGYFKYEYNAENCELHVTVPWRPAAGIAQYFLHLLERHVLGVALVGSGIVFGMGFAEPAVSRAHIGRIEVHREYPWPSGSGESGNAGVFQPDFSVRMEDQADPFFAAYAALEDVADAVRRKLEAIMAAPGATVACGVLLVKAGDTWDLGDDLGSSTEDEWWVEVWRRNEQQEAQQEAQQETEVNKVAQQGVQNTRNTCSGSNADSNAPHQPRVILADRFGPIITTSEGSLVRGCPMKLRGSDLLGSAATELLSAAGRADDFIELSAEELSLFLYGLEASACGVRTPPLPMSKSPSVISLDDL